MGDKRNDSCIDEKDLFYHLMAEQIAYISVKEEEEELREEMENHHSQTTEEDIRKH